MLKRLPLVFLLCGSVAFSAGAAEIRELNQDELRSAVASGQSQDLGLLMALVAQNVQGELVDVRGFLAGDVFFQLTLLRPDGSLVTIVVNGSTGTLVSSNSTEAKVVRAAAKANGGNSHGQGNAGNNRGAGGNSNGNGNSGGNGGNGNSGGGGSSGGSGNGKK